MLEVPCSTLSISDAPALVTSGRGRDVLLRTWKVTCRDVVAQWVHSHVPDISSCAKQPLDIATCRSEKAPSPLCAAAEPAASVSGTSFRASTGGHPHPALPVPALPVPGRPHPALPVPGLLAATVPHVWESRALLGSWNHCTRLCME